MPLAHSRVPSMGSTATSTAGPVPSPTSSPLNSIGAWSFSPSPMTTTPRIDTELIRVRMAFTAAPSAPFLSPRPTQRAAAIAAASVTRASSRARFRFGACSAGSGVPGTPVLLSVVMVTFALHGLVDCPGEELGRLGAGRPERHVEDEERDPGNTQLTGLSLVLAHLVGVPVAAQHVADGARVEPGPGRHLDQHPVVEDLAGLGEVGLVERADDVPLHPLGQPQVNDPVQVEGVADGALGVEAEPLGPRQRANLPVGLARLVRAEAVL